MVKEPRVYDQELYTHVLDELKLMYEGYEDFYWDLVFSLEPYDLILFYDQVNEILSRGQSHG